MPPPPPPVAEALAGWLRAAPGLALDHREVERRLLERWPTRPRDVVLAHAAAREGVSADLVRGRGAELPLLVYEALARRLHDDAGLGLEDAGRAVRLWAEALGRRAPAHAPRPSPPERWTGPAIRVLRLRGAPVELRGHRRPARVLRFWGSQLVSAGEDRTVRWWDRASARLLGVGMLGHRDWIRALVWDGARWWSGGQDGALRAWEGVRRAARVPLFTAPVVGLERSAPLELVAAVSSAGELALLPSVDRAPQLRLDLAGPCAGLCVEAQGRWVAVARPGRVQLLNPEEGALLRELPTAGVPAIAGGSSDLLLVGDEAGLRLLRASEGEELQRFVGHVGPVRAVALHAGGQSLASAAEDGSARIWQASDGRETYRLEPGRAVRAVALSEAGALALSVSDGAIILCDMEAE